MSKNKTTDKENCGNCKNTVWRVFIDLEQFESPADMESSMGILREVLHDKAGFNKMQADAVALGASIASGRYALVYSGERDPAHDVAHALIDFDVMAEIEVSNKL